MGKKPVGSNEHFTTFLLFQAGVFLLWLSDVMFIELLSSFFSMAVVSAPIRPTLLLESFIQAWDWLLNALDYALRRRTKQFHINVGDRRGKDASANCYQDKYNVGKLKPEATGEF